MRDEGFTLIELMIVIALIIILSALGIGSYVLSTTRSYDTQRKNDLNQISKALESFNNDVGRYPLSDASGNILCYQKAAGVVTNPDCAGNKLLIRIDDIITNYITVPVDPNATNKYIYESDGSSFSLYTVIQNSSDKDLLLDVNNNVITNPYNKSCGAESCNYKITEVGLSKTNE
ncbi:MAG: hypothetical protein ACD_58C00312G0002 [uncultured bacterium]|nr:MAG: hypothetical protein ACD_58C00312G0002 [uncultured bacterium]